MKDCVNRRLVACLSAFLPCLMAADPAESALDRSAGLHAADRVADLGEVFVRQVVEHRFRLENLSDKTLDILEVEKSCSCTGISLESMAIAPGESVSLQVALSTGHRLGELDASLAVHWRIRGEPEAGKVSHLALKARVVALLTAKPEQHDFGVLHSDNGTRTVRMDLLRGAATQGWDELIASTKGRFLALNTQRVNEDHYTLEVTLDPTEVPAGRFKREVVLKFKEGGKVLDTDLRIPVEAMIVSNVSARPASIYFGAMDRHATKSEDLTISTSHEGPFEFVSVASSDPMLRAELVEGQADKLRFRCIAQAGERTGNASGWLRFKVKSDREREILVPVIAYVKGAEAKE